MIKDGFLEQYTVKLTTKSPLFVGSGKEINKKEYIFNKKTKKAAILDYEGYLNLIIQKNLIDEYESFFLSDKKTFLSDFISHHRLEDEVEKITLYKTDVAEALTKKESPIAIKCFIRDKNNIPYVPGSSLKGALRTALLIKKVSENPKPNLNPDDKYAAKKAESEYLNYLNIMPNKPNKPKDELNSVMRGIYVSDSLPIKQTDMCLCAKRDIFIDGSINPINQVRECVKPGVEITFTLTLNRAIAKDINIEYIKSTIKTFGQNYKALYMKRFKLPSDVHPENFESCLILGGGAGFFSKTITYPLLGENKALRYVSGYMKKIFTDHYHHRDMSLRVSPHTLKYTKINGEYYHFGVCKVDI